MAAGKMAIEPIAYKRFGVDLAMRIVYVTEKMPFGPGEAFVLTEVLEVIRQGHEVCIIPTFPGGKVIHHDAQQLLGHTRIVPLASQRVWIGALTAAVRHPGKVARVLIHLLHSPSFRAYIRNLQAFVKGLYAAQVITLWGADYIHAHWANYSATLAMIASKFSDVPWGFTAHRYDIVAGNLLEEKLRSSSFVRVISKSGLGLLKNAVKKELSDKMFTKIHVIHMGTNIDVEPVSDGDDPEPFTILCPANLVAVKGHTYLIHAMALLVNRGLGVRLLIAGDGPQREALETLVMELDLKKRIKFVGHLPHEQLMALYHDRQVSCVVLPSVILGPSMHEGIPVSLIEAMACGIPVIGTNTGGIPELLDGEAGLLVPEKDPAALAEVIARLVQSPEIRKRLAETGHRRVAKEFCLKGIVELIIELMRGNNLNGQVVHEIKELEAHANSLPGSPSYS